ncbi:hypothetical protein E2C01_082179 [Portunus trituberculatus]|uniref:Uncharacterized protein n=1 Tax=Portunus trituberculatus TaxID=210409 RepID=A0A5B7IRP3_PORTR|nr:hypothetical protein [Portunus trituberculatus]
MFLAANDKCSNCQDSRPHISSLGMIYQIDNTTEPRSLEALSLRRNFLPASLAPSAFHLPARSPPDGPKLLHHLTFLLTGTLHTV